MYHNFCKKNIGVVRFQVVIMPKIFRDLVGNNNEAIYTPDSHIFT